MEVGAGVGAAGGAVVPDFGLRPYSSGDGRPGEFPACKSIDLCISMGAITPTMLLPFFVSIFDWWKSGPE